MTLKPTCCVDCVFFVPKRCAEVGGTCHRFPQAVWKDPLEWCGEFVYAATIRTPQDGVSAQNQRDFPTRWNLLER